MKLIPSDRSLDGGTILRDIALSAHKEANRSNELKITAAGESSHDHL
jgi:hypothetical protein